MYGKKNNSHLGALRLNLLLTYATRDLTSKVIIPGEIFGLRLQQFRHCPARPNVSPSCMRKDMEGMENGIWWGRMVRLMMMPISKEYTHSWSLTLSWVVSTSRGVIGVTIILRKAFWSFEGDMCLSEGGHIYLYVVG